MGPIDTTDIYDIIWSDADHSYISFPRHHDKSRFETPGLFAASTLAGTGAIKLSELKPKIDELIEHHSEDYNKWFNETYGEKIN